MKNLKWLKEETLKINNTVKENLGRDTLKYAEGVFDGTKDILKMIDVVEQSRLPVIPQFVAEFIEENKKMANHWFEALDEMKAVNEEDGLSQKGKKVLDYIVRKPDDFVDAYRFGYTTNKEKKYHVRNNRGSYMLLKSDGVVLETWCVPALGEETYELTEKEIKDFDERYWEFRREPFQ